MRLLIVPAIFMALSAALFFGVSQLAVIPESMDEAVRWLRGFDQWLWIAAIGVIVADSFLMMPSDAAMMALGLVYGTLAGGVLAGIGSVGGGMLAFGLVRRFGQGAGRRLVGERDLARARAFYRRWGGHSIAAARAVGGPAESVLVLAGLSHMHWRTVLLAMCIGGIPTGVLKAALGSVAEERPIAALLAALALALVASRAARRWLEEGEEAGALRPEAITPPGPAAPGHSPPR